MCSGGGVVNLYLLSLFRCWYKNVKGYSSVGSRLVHETI